MERKISDSSSEIAQVTRSYCYFGKVFTTTNLFVYLQRDKLIQDLTLANGELNDRFRRRSDECDRLRDDLKSQAAELVTLQARLKDSQFNLNEFQTSTLPTQYELTKTVHEKNLLADRVRDLEGELQRKAQEERAYRAECAGKADELNLALSSAQAQLEAAHKQLAVLKVRLCVLEQNACLWVTVWG